MTFILSIIFKTSIVLICGAIATALLKRSAASTRYAVWVATFVAVAVVPILALVLPSIDLPILPAQVPSAVAALPQAGGVPANITLRTSISLPFAPSEPVKPTNWTAFAWVVGAVVIFSQMLLGAAAVFRVARKAKPADTGFQSLMAELKTRFAITHFIKALITEKSITPMTWGLIRPTILLPLEAQQWTQDRRVAVLVHELAHVKRRDGIIQVFVHAIVSVFWFNPLVWFAAYRLRIERERACDDHVIAMGVSPQSYAEHLLDIARSMRSPRSLSIAAVSMAHRSQLESRLLSILDSNVNRRGLRRLTAALVGVLCLAVVTPLAALRGAEQTPRTTYFVTQAAPSSPQQATPRDVETELRKKIEELQAELKKLRESMTLKFTESIAPELTFEAAKDWNEEVTDWVNPKETYFIQMAADPADRERAISGLIEALKDPSEDVRTAAISALAELREPRIFDQLMNALKDDSEDVRSAAAAALGELRDPRALKALTAALKDASSDVRRRAAWAISQLAKE